MHVNFRESSSFDFESWRSGREKLEMLSEIRCWRLIDMCVVMRFAISPERHREESDVIMTTTTKMKERRKWQALHTLGAQP